MKPSIPSVIHLFADYYSKNASWGSLHIVMDDGNVTDDNVRFCKEWARKENDKEGERLSDILLLMSKSQRIRISKKAESWVASCERMTK